MSDKTNITNPQDFLSDRLKNNSLQPYWYSLKKLAGCEIEDILVDISNEPGDPSVILKQIIFKNKANDNALIYAIYDCAYLGHSDAISENTINTLHYGGEEELPEPAAYLENSEES